MILGTCKSSRPDGACAQRFPTCAFRSAMQLPAIIRSCRDLGALHQNSTAHIGSSSFFVTPSLKHCHFAGGGIPHFQTHPYGILWHLMASYGILWHLMASYSHVEISMNSENHLQAAALKSIRMKVPQGKPPWGGPPIGQNAFRRTNAVKKCPARLGDNQQRGSDFQVLFQACHESGSGWIWIKLDKSWARHPNMFSGSTMSLQPTFVTLPFKVSKGHPRPRSSRLEEPEKTGKTNHEQNWTNTGKQNEKKNNF